MVAGTVVGPATPGFVADEALAAELAETGVILLMFGVGLHFSLKDLVSAARVAISGAVGQIAVATLMGAALAWALGWGLGAGLVFGLALSVASTVMLVHALQERRILDRERGRVAVGWLVVEDIAMILALELLPAVATAAAEGGASADQVARILAATLARAGAFVGVMLVGGQRLIPWPMRHAAHTGSRELFRLTVYVSAIGIAYAAAEIFSASFARDANPDLEILARGHSNEGARHLDGLGASLTVLRGRAVAHRMVERAFPSRDRDGGTGAGAAGAQDGAG